MASKELSSEDSEIFEIVDFTTATDYERFVARLEEVIHEWKLSSSQQDSVQLAGAQSKCVEIIEEIDFAGYPFIVTHYNQTIPDGNTTSNQNKDDGVSQTHKLMKTSRDFPDNVHCICRWFGVYDFLVISPKSYHLTNESRINTVLSAINNAIFNSECRVAVFLQALESWRKFYLGRYLNGSIETSYDMVHLRTIPNKFRHLSGLLNVFRGKLNIQNDPKPVIQVSVRFTYMLEDWEEYMFDWPQAPPTTDSMERQHESAAIGFTSVDKLPFGACKDPVCDFLLFTSWSNVSEEVITESDVYNDLEPMNAPQWSVRVTFTSDLQCLLADCLVKFVDICHRTEKFENFIVRIDESEQERKEQISNVLDKMSSPAAQYPLPVTSLKLVSKAVSNTRLRLSSAGTENSPIPVDVLNSVLLFIFPDADDKTNESTQATAHNEANMQFKTAPKTSSVYKLAVCCCLVNYAFGGLKAVSHLWHEFVLEMRYRLENSVIVPGIEKGSPNLGQGLLYQKIQMLNCCIVKKKLREDKEQQILTNKNSSQTDSANRKSSSENLTNQIMSSENLTNQRTEPKSAAANRPSSADSLTNSLSDEEFFECEESSSRDGGTEITEAEQEGNKLTERKAEAQGRLAEYKDMKLLNSDELLYLPITQETAPMTEDILEEHADVLTKLGTGEEGAALRAKMQSSNLLSDMMAFKAANPGCMMEDFVRWYSPRDFIYETVIDKDTGETTEQGRLSDRMLVPDNAWQETWNSALPIPARRQKRLFDDTKEAEKVLHYLSSLTPSQLTLHLLPIVCQEALVRIQEESKEDSVLKAAEVVEEKLSRKTREYSQTSSLYTDVLHHIKSLEAVIAKARSLRLKFSGTENAKIDKEIDKFTQDLLQGEVKVIGGSRGPVGRILIKMFRDARKAQHDEESSNMSEATGDSNSEEIFPAPSAREYILKCEANRPAPYSQSSIQRMYCTLTENEYRLAGGFSADTTFS